MAQIGIVGEYDPNHPTHPATGEALTHSADRLGVALRTTWLPTAHIVDPARDLDDFDGFIIAPGSPYRSLDGALAAIEYARTRDRALLGTCGGFQHLIVEFARNVLGVKDAGHAEYNPNASQLFVTPLSCSLRGQTMLVKIEDGTRAADAYGTLPSTERYYCNFGLNGEFLADLLAAGLTVSGVDQDGEVRIVELSDLTFFVGTLFVPQTTSTPDAPHPLVTAFLATAARTRAARSAGRAGPPP